MSSIDKTAVRRSFNRSASFYDNNAHLQRAVANRLLAQATNYTAVLARPAARILDAGAGSGFSTAALTQAFPHSTVIALDFAQVMLEIARGKASLHAHGATFVCGDVETPPFAPESFDLVYSSSVLQWNNLQVTLGELRRVLKKDHPLLVSIYTEGTLHELRDSWSAIDDYAHILNFPTPRQLSRAFTDTDMRVALCQTQREISAELRPELCRYPPLNWI